VTNLNRAIRNNAYRVITFRGWPGLAYWEQPKKPPRYYDRLADRRGIVIVAFANLSASIDEFGGGAFLIVTGKSVHLAGLIIPDGTPETVVAELERWAMCHPLVTTTGDRPWSVLHLSEFCDPSIGEFARVAYTGAGWCIGADLGRTLSLLAVHVGWRHGANDGECEIWLPGWGREHERGRWKRRSPHRPQIWIEPRRIGWRAEFASVERGNGRYERGRQWRGGFFDTLSLAYALDAERGASFAEHLENVGLPPFDLPFSVHLDVDGAQCMADAVLAVHALTVALDDRASRWF
jgi:hypothetical protein